MSVATPPLLGDEVRLTDRAVPRAAGDDTVGQVIAALHGGGFGSGCPRSPKTC